MLGAGNVALQENGGVAERIQRLVLCFGQQALQQARLLHDPHAAAATAERGLDDERKADFMRDLQGFVSIGDRLLGAGEGGDVELVSQRAGRGLVAHVFQQFWRRTDEGDALTGAGAGKGGVFREKAVAGMDQRHALRLRHRDDALDVEVGADRPLVAIQSVGLVGLEAVDGKAIFLGVNGNGAETEFIGGAENTDRDFPAVGGQKFRGAVRVFNRHAMLVRVEGDGWQVLRNKGMQTACEIGKDAD